MSLKTLDLEFQHQFALQTSKEFLKIISIEIFKNFQHRNFTFKLIKGLRQVLKLVTLAFMVKLAFELPGFCHSLWT